MEFVKKNALGILICLVIAVPAWLLGQRFEVVGGPVFAILIGMVIALFWNCLLYTSRLRQMLEQADEDDCQKGVYDFFRKKKGRPPVDKL